MPLEHKRQAAVKYQCGAPKAECSGSLDGKFGTSDKLHATVEEARLCNRRHLLAQGFVQIGPNVWLSPEPAEALKVT